MRTTNVTPESDAADVGCRDCKHAQRFDVTTGGSHRMMCGKIGKPIVAARDTRRGPNDIDRCGPRADFFERRV